jgi:hypothetical protein
MKVGSYLITLENSTFNYTTVLKKDVETIDIYGLGNDIKQYLIFLNQISKFFN